MTDEEHESAVTGSAPDAAVPDASSSDLGPADDGPVPAASPDWVVFGIAGALALIFVGWGSSTANR
jgi:hypothetical protein